MSDSKKDDDSNTKKVWDDLVEWVQKAGGHIHPALQLRGKGPSRGVVATQAISKGDLLIRIPPSCVVSGATTPIRDEKVSSISSWLKCVAAYYEASTNQDVWGAYFDSLPTNQYETLFQWTDKEIQTYLAGTSLGTMIQSDRQGQSMQSRYRLAVRPHLQKLGLTGTAEEISDKEFDAFLQACMCISTRGFHLTRKEGEQGALNDNGEEEYNGPFLLPVIDLLNHDPKQACTTLQRDAGSGMFCMTAERPIAKDEAVVHSYGDSLTSSQLLQTFGFVPDDRATVDDNRNEGDNRVFTPACFRKAKHLLAACQATKESSYLKQLQEWMQSQKMEDDEVWDVHGIPSRTMDDDISEDLFMSMNDGLLSEELITLVCVQFLPPDAYDEICPNDRISAWLDRSILEDYYLGKLVCHSLLTAIQNKEEEYIPLDSMDSDKNDSNESALERDKQALQMLLLRQQSKNDVTRRRAVYGLTVRMEEMTCLGALRKEVLKINEWLDQGQSIDLIAPPTKRLRVEES